MNIVQKSHYPTISEFFSREQLSTRTKFFAEEAVAHVFALPHLASAWIIFMMMLHAWCIYKFIFSLFSICLYLLSYTCPLLSISSVNSSSFFFLSPTLASKIIGLWNHHPKTLPKTLHSFLRTISKISLTFLNKPWTFASVLLTCNTSITFNPSGTPPPLFFFGYA